MEGLTIMEYFSMFSGIGGFEYGIGEKGECIGFSEIDKYAKSIYQYHFPDHIDWGDATKIKTKTLPEFDLLVGGFPCQAFSIAGKREGFKDTRGTLFFEIARVLKDKRPRHFLLENVAGLLSHENGKTIQTIIRVLTQIGYRIEWQVLNSKDFGVPQNRERVFIIGHLGRGSRGTIFPINGNTGKTAEISFCLDANYYKGCNDLKKKNRTVVSVPLRYLDRNQKNFPSEYSMCIDSSNTNGVMRDMRLRRFTPIECERLQGFPDNYTKHGLMDGETVEISDSQRYKCLGNAVTTTVIKAIMEKFTALYAVKRNKKEGFL